jgi:hypothetical protein
MISEVVQNIFNVKRPSLFPQCRDFCQKSFIALVSEKSAARDKLRTFLLAGLRREEMEKKDFVFFLVKSKSERMKK